MPDQRDDTARAEELGDSFAAHNSESIGGDVGQAFAEKNAEEERRSRIARQSHHSWIWWTVGIVLVLALVLFLAHGKGGKSGAGAAAGGKGGAPAAGGGRGQQGPASITVAPATTGNMNVYVNALGTVTPTNTVTIYSQITGKVMAIHYREGQIVTKGQPLIEIDPRPYEATLTQAEGTL